MRKRSKRPFTLLEITLCIAILGLLAGFLGWHIKTMVDSHSFHKHVDLLLTDLRKLQIVALAQETDIEVNIHREEGKYGYIARSAEPGAVIKNSFVPLEGVKTLKEGETPRKSITLHITPDGRILPATALGFFPKGKNLPLWLDLSYHPKIKIKGEVL